MNCPMCGAPLGDNDLECSRCFTKRSEMGPAYNNNGGYGGSSYQSGGYGNNGYGNNSYGNNSYGNTGYGNGGYDNSGNQNNGYGTSYNTSYGSTNNYGSANGMGNYGGMGYTSAGTKVSNPKNLVIVIMVVVVFVGAAVYSIFIKPNTFKTFDTGDYTVSLPVNCTKTDSMELDLRGLGEAVAYQNGDMWYESIHMNLNILGVTENQVDIFKDEFVKELNQNLRSRYPGYTNKGSTDNMLKFSFNKAGTPMYVEMKLIFEGKDMYVAICMCTDKDAGRMKPKFSKVFNSIDIK